ncbi:MAG TPA: glycoside hydrolase family 30 beta sandwich domain-containing protein [Luteimonas sp.]|nr:glycoside hydrolase family 30 beta sandwich domain-containing protein [Luteimonas sp.]
MKSTVVPGPATPARWLLLCFGIAMTLGACASGIDRASTPGNADGGRVQVWVTTSDHSQTLTPATSAEFAEAKRLPITIDVDSGKRFQEMVGFGAAITDASAWLIQYRMDANQRKALLQELFGRSPGIGLSFTRLTIGASDFSRRHYSLDDVPAGSVDPGLARFSIEPNRADVVPVTRAALAINPQLKVMASPWSAPAWMKTTDSLIKGTLREEYYDAFARYLVRYVDGYAAEGIPIFALTLLNEPSYEPDDYPGMRLSSRQRARLIADHLGPLLQRRASSTLIFDWDHNWDKPEEPLGVLSDQDAARHVAGVAWHCYGGDVAAQSKVHDAFPDKDAYLTECSGGDWEPVRSGGLTLLARQLIIQAPRHWARGVLFWNLALDEKAGPHAGGCDTCRGVVTIHTADGSVTRNDEYYALAHASRFVRPGAYRIHSGAGQAEVDNVAFRNADDGSIVLIVTNSAGASRRFSVASLGRTFEYALPAKSLATFVWQPDGESSGTEP